MFGICNECGKKEESNSIKCTGCGHSWHLFPARPKDLDNWLKPKGYWDRARRCYPPNVLNGLFLGLIFFSTFIVLDIWAIYNKIHLTSYQPFTYIGICFFDMSCIYLGLKTIRVSMKHYKMLRVLILLGLALTTILFVHTVTQVVGHDPRSSATTYLAARFIFVVISCFLFLRGRVLRALHRHG